MKAWLKTLQDKLQSSKKTDEVIFEKKILSIERAGEYIQDVVANSSSEVLDIINEAVAGAPGMKEKVLEFVRETLESHLVTVEGMTSKEASEIIYKNTWGLEVLQDLYDDPEVSELRFNGLEVFITRKGVKQSSGVFLSGPEQAGEIIKRLMQHDVGVSLNESNPRAYSVRKDGSRVTSLCFPAAVTWSCVIRKHHTFDMSPENLEKHGTMDKKTYMRIRALYVGGANIIIVGPGDAGKTSLLRRFAGELPSNLRVISLGKDREILLGAQYSGRDILELEEHEEINVTMRSLFETILTLSPDVIIVEELKGYGEALETIRACTRGHRHSGTTAHFNDAIEAVEGIGMMMIEEGLNLPLDMAMMRVARAYNLVLRKKKCHKTGVKKLFDITEIGVIDGKVYYRPLVEWVPDDDDNKFGPGKWVPVNMPTEGLLKELDVSRKEVEELWKC